MERIPPNNGEISSRKRGCVAGVDYPVSLKWKELSEVYPNAKVVLSTRYLV